MYADKDLGPVCRNCGRAEITRHPDDEEGKQSKRDNHAWKLLDKLGKNWRDSPSYRWEDYEEVETPSVSPNCLVD